MDHPTHELEAYFAGDATDEQLHVVEAWINADPANARAFIQQLHFRELVGEHLREQRSDNRAVLAELARLEAAQEANVVTIIDLDHQIREQDRAAISASDYAAVGSYLLRHALTPKRLVYGGLAAALLLGLTIFIALQGGTPLAPTVPTGVVQTPEDVQEPQRIVATLTAQHDAHWEQGALALGSRLQAGQSLALTAGFAQITTQDGAVATLEAPCTVELLGDNALRLTSGKLAATVPPKAVGFTVHTPTAQVIDYGTQFGVEVGQSGTTHTAVFVGEVELRERSGADERPSRSVRLTTGWASQVSDRGQLQAEATPVTASDRVRYVQSIDEVIAPGFAYRRAVLASKPLVYWGFDEGNETTRNLANQDTWDGQAIGQTRLVQGLFGNALKLTGQIESMGGFASASPLKIADTSRYTLEAWCWIDQPHHGRVIGLAEYEQGQKGAPRHASMLEVVGGEGLFESLRAFNPSVRFFHRSDLSNKVVPEQNTFTPTGPEPGQWVHLVAVRDGKQARIYVNGEMVSESIDDQPAAAAKTLGLYVGVSPTMLVPEPATKNSEHRCFNGLIDEVAVYDHVLKADQIALHFQLGLDSSRLGDE